MTGIRIYFETENDAFHSDPAAWETETKRILHDLADKISFYPGNIRDINGNKIGYIDYEEVS